MKTIVSILAVLAVLLPAFKGFSQMSVIPWSVIDMGYAVSSSSTTSVTSVVGQGFTGTMTGTSGIIESGFLADTLFRAVVVSVAEGAGIPKEYALHQNYPNPFNPSTTIRFELPHASRVIVKIYNILGQEVLTLLDEEKPAGVYDIRLDAANLATGAYVYRMQAGNFVAVKKLMFLR